MKTNFRFIILSILSIALFQLICFSPFLNVYSQEEQKEKPYEHYAIIKERNIFAAVSGRSDSLADVVLAAEDIKTDLPLLLKATVVSTHKNSFALIEDTETGNPAIYHTGDSIKNMTIIAIERNRIILRGIEGDQVLTTGWGKQLVSKEKEEGVVEKTAEVKKKVEHGNARVVSRKLVEDTVKNMHKLLTEVRIRPYFNKGKADGFRISNIKPGSLIEEMGFRNGDIVRSVNNQIIDNPEKIITAYQKLIAEPKVSVGIRRGGGMISLDYEIRD